MCFLWWSKHRDNKIEELIKENEELKQEIFRLKKETC